MLNNKHIRVRKYSFIVAISAIILSSCISNSLLDELVDDRSPNEELYYIMQNYYYWYSRVPSVNPNSFADPYALLDHTMYKAVDRWSFVTSYYEFMQYYQSGEMEGYGILLIEGPNSDLYTAFLYDDSPLKLQGVKRGWRLLKIDNIEVTSGNFYELLSSSASNTFVFLDENGMQQTVSASKKSVSINTVLYKNTYIRGADKIGYLVLESFIEPTENELATAFNYFKTEGITELILDLRYNGGGLVNVANFLAASINASVTSGSVFIKYIYNDKLSNNNSIERFEDSGFNLSLNRLVVIATSNTASASELVINSLEPFLDVVIVGDDTHGKPVGMSVFQYQGWAFAPVLFETVNSNNQGGYLNGLKADVYVEDDLTHDWGDTLETSLAAALDYIETGKKTHGKSTIPATHLLELKNFRNALILTVTDWQKKK
jgi:C-terminal processing protease CtpA/Prc